MSTSNVVVPGETARSVVIRPKTAQAVSPGVSVAQAATSLIALTLLYAALMVIEVRLMLTYVRRGPEPFTDPHDDAGDDHDRPLAFAY